MTSMNRKDIIAGLVTLLDAEVEGLGGVDAETRSVAELSESGYPHAIVIEGPTRAGGFVTKTEQLFMTLKVEIYCDSDSSDNDLRDLSEAVIDAVNSDLTLGGTCIICNFMSMGRPQFWPQDSFKYIDVFFEVQYWRDIA